MPSASGEYNSDQELNAYQVFVTQRIADGVQRANNLLQPAEIAFASVDVPEHLFNRRWYLKEGSPVLKSPFGKIDKVKMNPPGGSPDLIEPLVRPIRVSRSLPFVNPVVGCCRSWLRTRCTMWAESATGTSRLTTSASSVNS